MSSPNAELAYRVLDFIDADPESWQQAVWIRHECGTIACFAGWACLLSGDVPAASSDDDHETEYVHIPWQHGKHFVALRAAELLGLDYDTSSECGHELFSIANTREDLGYLVAAYFGQRPDGAS